MRATESDNTASSLWPSAILLSLFLQLNLPKHSRQVILELGAGLGLTALVVLKSCDIDRYILQEWPDKSICETLGRNLSRLRKDNYGIITGIWGHDDLHEKIINIEKIDELIMADCFYCKENFIPLLSTISHTLWTKKEIKRAICVYHHRNVNDSITKYLEVFHLNVRILEFTSDLRVKIDDFIRLNPELRHGKLLDFRDLFLVEFTRKQFFKALN